MKRTRRTPPLDRTQHLRDARFFLIATEGDGTEPAYFEALRREGLIDVGRVVIEVIRPGTMSAPGHVWNALLRRTRELDLRRFDQTWLVFDVDHHAHPNHVGNLHAVCREAGERGVGLAISNPCFELWLLLHHEPAGQVMTPAELVVEVRRCVPGYSKGGHDFGWLTNAHVDDACERAAGLDVCPDDPWPAVPGTWMSKLMQALRDAGRAQPQP